MKSLDKNAIIGFVLIGAILFTYMYLNRPTEAELQKKREQALKEQQEQQKKQQPKDTIIKKDTPLVSDSIKKIQLQNKYGLLAPYSQGKSRIVTVENETMKLCFDAKGANIVRVELKNFKTYYGKPLVLFEGNQNKVYCNFAMTNGNILNTDDLYFTVQGDTAMKLTGDKQSKVSFVAKIDENNYIERVFTLQGNSYIVGMDIHVKGMKEVLGNNSYELFRRKCLPQNVRKILTTTAQIPLCITIGQGT